MNGKPTRQEKSIYHMLDLKLMSKNIMTGVVKHTTLEVIRIVD